MDVLKKCRVVTKGLFILLFVNEVVGNANEIALKKACAILKKSCLNNSFHCYPAKVTYL